VSFFIAPGIVEHWNVEYLRPDIPGVQFLIQISNPGKADESQGVIAVPAERRFPGGGRPTSENPYLAARTAAPRHCRFG
jgi:hypothetical protein